MDKSEIVARLENYRSLLLKSPLPRREISRERVWIQKILQKTGTFKTITIGPPPMLGGIVMRDINPLDCLFDPPYGANVINIVVNAIDEAIGVVESSVFDLEMSQKIGESIHNVNRRVFLVHGHDNSMRLAVSCFLTQLNFTPVILNECPSNGQTIIEKLEKNSDVGFAIILLSPCDEGRERGCTNFNFRARQNVVAELGYFVGRLGRRRVFILRKENVEEISDFSGIVYTAFDEAGGWKIALMKDLKAAGFSFDAQALL